jgi:hypothetical protein
VIRGVLALAIVLVLVLGAAHEAAAYPHFQLTSGTSRCSACHFAPAGGGLLTPWGAEEASDTIARGGDGRFLHGAAELPDWLALGGDLRVAALANDTGSTSGTELAAFPMQADLAARAGRGAITFTVVAGVRGAVRSGAPTSPSNDASTVVSPSLGSYLISREHYAMWRPGEAGPYVRAGRFAAPYGLRLADHTTYVRRFLGGNLMEETYGISGGYLGDAWELHATGFRHDPLQGAARKETGGAVLVEAQPGSIAVLGASARAGFGPEDTRLQGGIHAKLWVERAKLLIQGEIDAVHQTLDAGGDRWQLASYLGPVWIPARGVYTGVAYGTFAEDLHVRAVTRHAGDAWISYLPRAHWEIMMSARAQRIGPAEHAYLGMLQVHYTL